MKLLFLILTLFAVLQVSASNEKYQFLTLNINNGLSNNQINCIYKDNRGFLWIGTSNGLNRYDGYAFKVFKHDPQSNLTTVNDNCILKISEDYGGKLWITTRAGLCFYNPTTEKFSSDHELFHKNSALSRNNNIVQILKDKRGNNWFVNETSGLFLYVTGQKRIIHLYHRKGDLYSPCSNEPSAITEDSSGNFWVIYRSGIMEKINGQTLRVVYRDYSISRISGERNSYNIFRDRDNDLWVYSTLDPRGIYFYNTTIHKLKYFLKGISGLNNNLVKGVEQDGNGRIWVGTDHGGINLIDKRNFHFDYLLCHEEDENSLAQNSIVSLYKANDGIIWVGTFKKGISYYYNRNPRFKQVRRIRINPRSLGYDDVNCFAEDARKNLWIGTNGGGLDYFDRTHNVFRHYVNQSGNRRSLSNNVVVSVCVDHEQKLWAGTYMGGLNCFDGKQFTRYQHQPGDPSSLSNDFVWKIFEDSRNNLWIGTLGGGLDLFNRSKKCFYHFRRGGNNNTFGSDDIVEICEDHRGNLWIGTSSGLDYFDRQKNRFSHFENSLKDPGSLSNSNVLCIHEDCRHWVWVGTREGLNLYLPSQRKFKIFRGVNGLPDEMVKTIQEDRNGNLWFGTTNGISNLQIYWNKSERKNVFRFRNYGQSDGLQGKEFNENSAFRTREGELIFGGANGFNIFSPEKFKQDKILPKIVLTNLQVFNRDVVVGEKLDGRIVLKKSITETPELVLKYRENVFSIQFAALNFFQTEKYKFEYRLDGFSQHWLKTDGNERKAAFTNLDPGKYTLRIRASNKDGYWTEMQPSLKIVVLPPFWGTNLAFFLYFCLIMGILAFLRYLVLEKERMNFRTKQAEEEAERTHHLDMLKIKFFTNISHEFRTPLSLIIAPIERLIQNAADENQKKQFVLIHRNARRLLNMVNQLLDFRKMEFQELKTHVSEGDIIGFIRDVVDSFSDLSEKKQINFTFNTKEKFYKAEFDHDKLEKILFNLLSNAFKFTPVHGQVDCSVVIMKKERPNEEETSGQNDLIEIKVADTGIGIPADKKEKIFERFFQNDLPKSLINQGSGIGLSLVHEFVKLLNGEVNVESVSGHGSCFTVTLPLLDVVPLQVQDELTGENLPELKTDDSLNNQEGETIETTNKKYTILIVEDNEDFRFYLKDNFKNEYNILEASDGQEGWRMTLSHLPDLIVSDIMMPVMDGIELCKKIKNDQRCSHIPVILLTARADDEQKVEGFQTGADDYITKPFDFKILESRIINLIGSRVQLRNTLQEILKLQPGDIPMLSLDDRLIQRALTLVEKNMMNPEYSVEEMSHELGMSRVNLYKKLSALTGKSPIEFIRLIRLRRAAQLLENSKLSVSEIAYQVGFNNPKIFAKYFKAEYLILPSAYAAEQTKK